MGKLGGICMHLNEVRSIVSFLVKSVDFEGNVIIGDCEETVRRGLILNLSRGMNDAGGYGKSGRCIYRILRWRSREFWEFWQRCIYRRSV